VLTIYFIVIIIQFGHYALCYFSIMESKSEFKPRWKLAQVLNVGKINLGMVNNISNYDSPQKRSVNFLKFLSIFL
jgi:hypothetical protein